MQKKPFRFDEDVCLCTFLNLDIVQLLQNVISSFMFLILGDQYYRLSQNRVEPGYPRNIRVWNMPDEIKKVDSVVTYTNGRSYFFAEKNYYAFDDARIRVSFIIGCAPSPSSAGREFCLMFREVPSSG